MKTAYRLEERRHDGKLLNIVGFYADADHAFAILRHALHVSPYLYEQTATKPHRLVLKVV